MIPMKPKPVILCPECDNALLRPRLQPGDTAVCPRCRGKLYVEPRYGVDTPLAFAVSSLFLFLVAILDPILSLELEGQTQATHLIGMALSFFDANMPEMAILVLFAAVIAPGLYIAGIISVLLAIKYNRFRSRAAILYGWIIHLQHWLMLDVLMIGVLVALVKLFGLAEVIVGWGLYAFAALIVLFIATQARTGPHFIFTRLENDNRPS